MQLVTYPSIALNTVCDAVFVGQSTSEELRFIVDKMTDVMYTSEGVGLAAPQVGIMKRIVLVDASGGMSENDLVVLVNPKIVWSSLELEEGSEGCLSLPGINVPIVRSIACHVEYHDITSHNTLSLKCTGLKARIVQHEIDHLDGITLVDKLGPFARRTALQDLKVNR